MNEEQSKPRTKRGDSYTVGVLSDTHGLLRPEVLELLGGADRILHAGDVGDPSLLADLSLVAPVTAVWGNVDGWDVRDHTAEIAEGELQGFSFAMIHGHQVVPRYERLIDRFPLARLIIYGHSHIPTRVSRGGVLLLNPGSAGPKRPGKPASIALIGLSGGQLVDVDHVDLETGRVFQPEGSVRKV